MLGQSQNKFITAIRFVFVATFIGLWMWSRWHRDAGTVPRYFIWILPFAVLSEGWVIYTCIERKLLAQLVVSICAILALPAFLIAPTPLSAERFWISLGTFGIFSFLGAGPIHLLDMFAPIVIVPFVWLECSSLAKDPDVAFYFHFAIFVAALPLVYRYIYWRLKYGYPSDIPDPEEE
jgi:hypothetical protein